LVGHSDRHCDMSTARASRGLAGPWGGVPRAARECYASSA
jgi:hypothetical protein